MPWYPHAIRKNIPPGINDPQVTPTQIIDHVAASTTSSLYGWFNGPSGGIESHFYVRSDGTVEQYRDTDYQADAQIGGGKNAISIETAGLSDGTWTDAQIAALIALHDWIADTHGIARQACPDPYGPGLGYHSMWGSTRAGTWAADGRTCPGPKRITQWRERVLPAFTDTSGDDMALTEIEIQQIASRIIDGTPMGPERATLASYLAAARRDAGAALAEVKALRAELAGGGGVDPAAVAAELIKQLGARS